MAVGTFTLKVGNMRNVYTRRSAHGVAPEAEAAAEADTEGES